MDLRMFGFVPAIVGEARGVQFQQIQSGVFTFLTVFVPRLIEAEWRMGCFYAPSIDELHTLRPVLQLMIRTAIQTSGLCF